MRQAIQILFFSVLLFQVGNIFSQQENDNIILRNSMWLYLEEDQPEFAKVEFDDSEWDSTATMIILDGNTKINFEGIVWFRKRFTTEEKIRNTIVGLVFSQFGGSEIYLDGQLIKSFGVPSKNPSEEEVYNPNMRPFPVYLDSSTFHVIAIRYSDTKSMDGKRRDGSLATGFTLFLGDFDAMSEEYVTSILTNTRIRLFLGTFFLTLAFLHLIIFLFYRKKKNNLLYSLFMLCASAFLFIPEFAMSTNNPEQSEFIISSLRFVIPVFLIAFHGMLYTLFYQKFPKRNIVLIGLMLVLFILLYLELELGALMAILLSIAVFVDSFRICLVAIIKKKRGAWIVGWGVMFLLLTILTIIIAILLNSENNLHITGDSLWQLVLILVIILAIISLPVSMTMYLAWDISQTSKELAIKLDQVQALSEQTIQQEKEKKKILEGQKEQLEIEVNDRTKEIRQQKEELELKNTEILDSINYAKRIQNAILPPKKIVKEYLKNSFILYKPKDIVAGDFYWLSTPSLPQRKVRASSEGEELPSTVKKENINKRQDNKSIPTTTKMVSSPSERIEERIILFAAADCTGHGVPGAMVSVVCNNGLNRSVREFGLTDPGQILDKTREIVIEEFERSEEEVKDGMDIALVSLLPTRTLSGVEGTGSSISYSGAHNPLWIIRKGAAEIEEIKANKQPIGKFLDPKPYKTHQIELQEGDAFYIFTDGYVDQFGGEKGKKFKAKAFRELLLSIQNKEMEEQRTILDESFEKWRGDLEQVDDICVIGVKI